MIEKKFNYSTGDEKAVEKLVMDEHVNIIHMVFNKDEGLPEHNANSNVYMTIIRGTLSLQLDNQEVHEYVKGNIVQMPFGTKMNVGNKHDEVMEMFVMKSPAPHNYNK
jgi:quercetin dioxygenase-like cupin family protein